MRFTALCKSVLTAAALGSFLSAGLIAQESESESAPAQDEGQSEAVAEAEVKVLTIGDKAPAYSIEHWVKGSPVTAFETGKIYVMEFWATWCPPCRDSMPHLSKLQEEYKDRVTIIGVSDEDLSTVTDFLGKDGWPEKTNYTLATDPDNSTFTDYMRSAQQNGIPTAFIVGKGSTIEWIGHPMEMDKVLKRVVAGEWDTAAYKKRFELHQRLDGQWQAQFQQGDYDGALKTLDEVTTGDPEDTLAPFVKFYILLTQKNDSKGAYALAAEGIKKSWDEQQMLMQYAGVIAEAPGEFTRDWDLAVKAGERAVELSKGEDAYVHYVMAGIYKGQGQLNKAIEAARRGVEAAKSEDEKKEMQVRLDEYLAEQKKDG